MQEMQDMCSEHIHVYYVRCWRCSVWTSTCILVMLEMQLVTFVLRVACFVASFVTSFVVSFRGQLCVVCGQFRGQFRGQLCGQLCGQFRGQFCIYSCILPPSETGEFSLKFHF